MLKDFKPRLYQQTIFANALNHNTLVVLPTGMGKTAIAVLLAIARLRSYPKSKILFLAPTRPLVQQHKDSFQDMTSWEDKDLAIFTGQVKPDLRKQLWVDSTIIFSTPQGMENDIINKNIDLSTVSLLIFDEAHKAVGDYAYNFIAQQYSKQAKYPRVMGLTASPGSDVPTIHEVMKNLHIEKIEVRTEDDPDVKEYIQEVDIEWVLVELPENYKKVRNHLSDCYVSKLKKIKEFGLLKGDVYTYSKTSILTLQSEIQKSIAKGEKDYDLLKAMSLVAEAMKVQHALELAETQGASALYEYIQKLEDQARTTKVKAVKNLVQDLNFRSAKILTETLVEKGYEHPKLYKLVDVVKKALHNSSDAKIIIFNQYRDQAEVIHKKLDEEGISSKIFVGQQKRKNTGLSQKKQKEVLDGFRQGEFSCLVATSVAEEGLDIPKVDMVLFYEPIPSAIRTIQRRGRTGRLEKGKVVVLLTKGTRDEGYRWAAHYKEKRMFKTLKGLRHSLHTLEEQSDKRQTLNSYISKEGSGVVVKIITDYREKNSALLTVLMSKGVDVQMQKLDVGDYLLSKRVCVEIKKIPDFVDSIIDGRLLSQIRDLRQYEVPIVILEGTQDIYSQRRIHPNAINGMLSTILLSYGISIVQTKNSKETAELLFALAKQEQNPDSTWQFHQAKPLTLKEQQEFIVSSLPGIGVALAKPLLKQFKSVKGIIMASEEELQQVALIGPVKARRIRTVLDQLYS